MAELTVPSEVAGWAWSADGGLGVSRAAPSGTAAWQWGVEGTPRVLRPIPESVAGWGFNTVGTEDIVRRELLPSSGVGVQVWDMLNPQEPEGFLAVLQYRELKFEKVHSDTGSFEITLARSYLGAEWLVKDNIVRVFVEGVERWAGYIEDVVEVPISEDERRSIKLVGRGLGKALEWGAIAPANFGESNQRTKRLWNQTSRGTALYELFTEIQERGTLPEFTADGWNELQGANGELWSTLVDLEFDAGGNYLELLQQWVNFNLEWNVDSQFRFSVASYLGRDLVDSVVVYPANTITAQENTITRRDVRTQMFTEDGNAEVSLIEDVDAVEEWGQREQYVVFKDALGQGTTTASGFAFLNLVKDQVIERRVSIDPFAPGRRPFLDFDTGDTIGAELQGEVFAFRVLAIAIGVDENGRTKAEITLDYVLEAQRRRRLALLNASSAGGGTSSGPQLVYGLSLGVVVGAAPATTCQIILESFVPTYGKAGIMLIGTAAAACTVTVDIIYDFGLVKSFPFHLNEAGQHTLDVTYLWLGIPEGVKQTWLSIRTNGPIFTINPLDGQYWVEAKGIAGSVLSSPNSIVDESVDTDLYTVIDSASTSDDAVPPSVVGDSVTDEPYGVTDSVGPTGSGEIELGVSQEVLTSSEDGTTSSAPSFSTVATTGIVGNVGGVIHGSFYRFDVPTALDLTGTTITAAWIEGVSTLNSPVLARTKIALADASNPATVVDRADFLSRTRVAAAAVVWESNQTVGVTYRSTDISAHLQELVDSYGDLESLLVFHQDDGGPADGRMEFKSDDTISGGPMVLRFRYVPG
jgi:hypothetical protein